MSDIRDGLYETLIDVALDARLSSMTSERALIESLRGAEAADRIALFLAAEVERAIETLPEDQRAKTGALVLASLIDRLKEAGTGAATDALTGDLAPLLPRVDPLRPAQPARVLRAVRGRRPDGALRPISAPLIPLLDTALLTNAPGEPGVGKQLAAEIDSADAIDVVMAFIRTSGIRRIRDDLARHCDRGRPLRILTTTYTGSTEPAALDLLQRLGADVRISYDTTSTRLHAKAWLFRRESGFTTAYIGSSNLTHSAQVTGLEWNVRVARARNRSIIEKVSAVFESYWASGDFTAYDADQFRARMRVVAGQRGTSGGIAGTAAISPLEVVLRPFQERLLEQIAVARSRGRHRNLLAAATGTGKTVMAAVDYARLRRHLPRARLLVVAHREEILDQSIATFRHVLRDAAFGEKWVRGHRPEEFRHVFASIQSLNASGIDAIATDHFDVVIVDEFHHAAAPSYRRLLERLQPQELIGLTATPERSDGLDVLQWFDGRIAAELRLWDAIDQQHLAPFAYYGISDGVDLTHVTWSRGRGYDTSELTNLYTGDTARANLAITQLRDTVGSLEGMRALGFCVSVAHAEFMAKHFAAHGIPALCVSGTSAAGERRHALQALQRGDIAVIFTVDLYNEGVDLPDVNTLLMLRPTESPTLFMQQLGRGLRRAPGKSMCTVLDFIGNHRREFRFDRKYRALLGGGRRDAERAVVQGFPFLPAGAHMELDRVAEQTVLRSIRQAIPSTRPAIVHELRDYARAGGGNVILSAFLDEAGLELDDIYTARFGWSDLCEEAGLVVAAAGPKEAAWRRGVRRLLHVDDTVRLDAMANLLAPDTPSRLVMASEQERRLTRMLIADFGETCVPAATSLSGAMDLVWQHPQVRSEILQLLPVLLGQVDHLHTPLALPDVPLQVHARYSRGEILAALGEGSATTGASGTSGISALPPPWREGVYHAKSARSDLLAFTLDKTSGAFSPTTRYRDYAISRHLIHWESQSTTRADSPTGLRYRQHAARGHSILLFARARADERAFYFLGPAQYVSHAGERPMAITWRLDIPLPGDLFEAFAAAVA